MRQKLQSHRVAIDLGLDLSGPIFEKDLAFTPVDFSNELNARIKSTHCYFTCIRPKMCLPEDTCLWLTISMCKGVPKLEGFQDDREGRAMRQNAWEKFKQAEERMKDACLHCLNLDRDEYTESLIATINQRSAELQAAREEYFRSSSDRPPNPFVVVTLDERDIDSTPMLHTQACRATCNPLFNHKFRSFPLGEYSVGRRAMAKFHDRDMDYVPRKLIFLVFHDEGYCIDGVPRSIDEERWTRASATQRHVLLARAEWDVEDLIRIINCPNEVTRNLPLYCRNGSKILDSELEIRVRVTSGRRIWWRCSSWFRR